jgi:transcriptional regulator with XRE-family HTH domain
MPQPPIVPAQIRAARALLDWSQDQLAKAAEIAVSSVRDVEGSRRPADAQTVTSIRHACENEGVVFLPGNEKEGFGVRTVANRPHLLRRPTVMTMWDGMPFDVEWQGKEVSVFVSREALDDLGRLTDKPELDEYLAVFEKFHGAILEGMKKAIADPANFDRRGHLHVRSRDIEALRIPD